MVLCNNAHEFVRSVSNVHDGSETPKPPNIPAAAGPLTGDDRCTTREYNVTNFITKTATDNTSHFYWFRMDSWRSLFI